MKIKKVYFSHIQQSNEILLADVKREGVLKESTEDNLWENIERKRTGDYQANSYMDSLKELLNEIEAQTLGFG